MSPTSPELCGRVALGTSTLAIEEVSRDRGVDLEALRGGLAAGAGIVDTARAYSRADDEESGERLVADVVHGGPHIFVITKGGHWRASADEWKVDNSAARLRRDAEASLRTLGRPTLDAFLLHRADDADLDLDRALSALPRIRADGLAARVGLSNVSGAQLEYAIDNRAVDLVQNEHSAASRDSAALALAAAHGIPYFAYSPLRTAAGRTLEETYPQLAEIAKEDGVSLPRLVLRGVLAESPVLSVITGATRVPATEDSVAAEIEPWDTRRAEAYATDLAAQGADG